jgi:hypothetical protein
MKFSVSFVCAASLACISTTALANEVSAPASFTNDGVTHTYVVENTDNGTVIVGSDGLKDYKLTVRGNRVSGYYGHTRVSFKIDDTASVFASAAN